jgi:hypothetical protein
LNLFKKRRKLIDYIGKNSFLTYQERVAMINWNIQTEDNLQENLKGIVKTLFNYDLLEYVLQSDVNEVLKVKPVYILVNENQLREEIVVKFKKKEMLYEVNLKKSRTKHLMHLNGQRKVRSIFSMELNYGRVVSIMFLFSFFNDKSWPATQGRARMFQNNNRDCFRSDINKWFDMAAVTIHNAEKATGVQINMNDYIFYFSIYITSTQLKFIIIQLCAAYQLVQCRTNLLGVSQISILIHIFGRVYSLYVMSWPETQGISSNSLLIFPSHYIRSWHPKLHETIIYNIHACTSQKAWTCLDYISGGGVILFLIVI